ILTFGPLLELALEAREVLKKEGILVRIVNARFIKPLDEAMLNHLINENSPILTIEESVVLGGFGSAVLEYLIKHSNVVPHFNQIGVPDYFRSHGARDELLGAISLTVSDIVVEHKTLIQKGSQVW